MAKMVQISEETLRRVYHLLNMRRIHYINLAHKAIKPEYANDFKAVAQGYVRILEEIEAALDAKE